MRSTRESTSSQADDGVEANDFQDPVEDQKEQVVQSRVGLLVQRLVELPVLVVGEETWQLGRA